VYERCMNIKRDCFSEVCWGAQSDRAGQKRGEGELSLLGRGDWRASRWGLHFHFFSLALEQCYDKSHQELSVTVGDRYLRSRDQPIPSD
jgi:hypothetical protein